MSPFRIASVAPDSFGGVDLPTIRAISGPDIHHGDGEDALLDITEAYGLRFLLPEGDRIVGASLRTHGEFAPAEVGLLDAYMEALEPGTLLDVGANIGAIGLPLARRHPKWRVLAFEAHRGLAGILAANALNNRLGNVEVHHAAAGATDTVVEFPTPPLHRSMNFGEIGFHLADHLEPVRMATLDRAAPPDARIVKLDVEGFESEVLKGAERLLKAAPVWFFEIKRGDPASVAVMARFLEAGYSLFWFFAPFVSPMAPKAPRQPQQLAGDYNCVALPPGAPNLWGLTRVEAADQPAPSVISAYRYLERFGFR